ncbi:MAG: oligosaccharide flippase family protein, partial [Clostridia bacterium]|nr:oligosaccharide flippase family protein [Clostridia bacterium]
MSKRHQKTGGAHFLQGAAVLSAGVLLVKLLGAIYKIPLTNMIGEVGMGYFNAAYQLYLPIYTLATAGFPVAVSRMVSEYTARGDPMGARAVFRQARRFFLCSGLLGTTCMAAGAVAYARYTGSPGAVWSIWALSPTVLLCCLMAPHRGYRSGLRQMEPTAVSQVIEATVRLFVGLGAAYAVIRQARQWH